LRVIARGRVSVYEPKGEYQLVCEHLEPHGLGSLQLAFEQLKQRLLAEGLFDAARKRRLPAFPRRVGIVTSLDGAAVRDIIKVLARRHANMRLVIRPTRVQGDGAPLEIARGLAAIVRVPQVDVVILGRGGGSIEDLWAFNEELVARAIARSPVPVISAVGHESDVTIADFVADVRAPTPSAAAEIVVAAKDELRDRIDRLTGRLLAAARRSVQTLGRRVHMVSGRPAFSGYAGRIAMRGRHVSELTHALVRATDAQLVSDRRRLTGLQRKLDMLDLGRRMAAVRTRLTAADAALAAGVSRHHHQHSVRLRECAGRLDALSPLSVLARGYAVCWDASRTRILRDAAGVETGAAVTVTLARGELACEVKSTSETR
jgi:exodeoxyribonuclease VII large subunit